jgi:energy-coupling factor transporter ATP-binding protein EcfA2
MARARSGGSVKPKLNILAYGPTGAGKSTLLLQMGYFKRDDGTPFRILLIDCESGGADECLNELEENGVDTENIYVVYTQSIKEAKDYINKVRDHEPFYVLDDNGEETDEIVKDAYGEQFVADAIILDGTSVLKLTNTQSLLDLSRKRNKIKAEKSGATFEEKFVATANANLELKDYSQLNYSGQDLVLTLMACGVHVGITAREKEKTENIKDENGVVTNVVTGKTFDSYKGMDYNVKTILRMFRNEDDQVCCVVEKDRMRRYPVGTVVEDPSLLDWEEVISKSKGKKEFTIKNDLDKAIETDQKIFEKQMLGPDYVVESNENTNTSDLDALKAEIKAAIQNLNPVQKKAMQTKLKEAGLPIQYNKENNEETLAKILSIVSE